MSTLDVVAYAGEEFGGVEAGQLPRHRRRCVGAGDGQRAGDHPVRPEVRAVFVNVFGGITACDAVANGIVQALAMLAGKGEPLDQAARRPARRQQRRRGARDPRRRRHSPGSSWSTRWTAPPAGWPSSPRQRRRGTGRHDGDLPHRELPDPRPGHDRLRGHQAHPADARVAARTSSRGHAGQGRPAPSTRTVRPCPSSAPSPRPWTRPAPTSPSSSCRRGSPRPPSSRRSTPASRCASSSPRASRCTTPPQFFQYAQNSGTTRHHRPELPRPHQPRPVQRRHHPGTITGPAASAWSRKSGHADLPDDVRAARPRLLHAPSASAATRSSAPRTSTASRRSRTTRRPTPS